MLKQVILLSILLVCFQKEVKHTMFGTSEYKVLRGDGETNKIVELNSANIFDRFLAYKQFLDR